MNYYVYNYKFIYSAIAYIGFLYTTLYIHYILLFIDYIDIL